MRRLGISTEGATEREFVNRIVRPHLTHFGFHTVAIDLRGNISLDKIRTNLPALFGAFDIVSTFFDFYGFKGRGNRTIVELENDILELVNIAQQQRFIPYVQQYEFEALLFAAPTQAVEWLDGSALSLAAMQEAVRKSGSPEKVNDSVETSPSHRLQALFSHYDKKLHGPEIIELVGLAEIRAQCPRFNVWLRRLESFGTPPPL
ncbi:MULTISPECIES: DUF4276 family protein [Janthinobacterium]|uniref:DUF4276 family protein n=1 Tax=Janthinobacterium TaxID=29580 RepID=UPI001C5AAFA8|nr:MULTISPECIES: DUF4276 family protein [Janthinobacterium]MBW3510727.1 DUF4276 family protein [Janthinobacterium sp. NKUCC06_STL]MCA1863342.1 DUF4276 family protein [Janthinobacterium lividum]